MNLFLKVKAGDKVELKFLIGSPVLIIHRVKYRHKPPNSLKLPRVCQWITLVDSRGKMRFDVLTSSKKEVEIV